MDCTDSAAADDDQGFGRKAFIDGLTYLLRGLPQDLDAREIDQLRSAAPSELARCCLAEHRALHDAPTSRQPRSVLHRAVQAVVVQAVLLCCFLLPYLTHVVRFMISIERKHKISDKVFEQGTGIARVVSRQGTMVIETVCDLTDGRFSNPVAEAVAWTVGGVVQGVTDGVGEALVIQNRASGVLNGPEIR